MGSNDHSPPWNHSPAWSAHLWLTLGYFVAASLLWGSFEVHTHEFDIRPQAVLVACLVLLLVGSNLIMGLAIANRRPGESPSFAMLATAHGFAAIPLGICLLGLAIDLLPQHESFLTCRKMTIRDWGFAPGEGGGSTLRVTVSSERTTALRLSFPFLWDESGHQFASYTDLDDPIVLIEAGQSKTLTYPQEGDGRAAALVQFALCSQPGTGTESCTFWGYGNWRLHNVARCALPPPTPQVKGP